MARNMPEACNKISYGSQHDAKKAAKQTPGGKKAYRCPRCSNWHIGANSKSRKKQRSKTYGGYAVLRGMEE